MSFIEQQIEQVKLELAEVQRVESIRTSTAKRFTVSSVFQQAVNDLTAKLEVLNEIKFDETISIFKDNIESQIPIESQITQTNSIPNIGILALIIVGTLLVLR